MRRLQLLNESSCCFRAWCFRCHNFTADPSTVCDYGHWTNGELDCFTYCLLQKIKAAHALPLIEKWEQYMLPNHSRFLPIEEEEFVPGSQIAVALEKVDSFNLRNEFQKDAQKILEEITSTVLSIVATRSDVEQRLSCFFPENVIG